MEILGIHHVNLTVKDADEARAFYVDVIGLAVRGDRPDFPFGGWWLDVGAQQVHLVVGEPRTETFDHFAIQVGDLDTSVAELRAKGLKVSDPQGVGVNRQSFLRDPWGNRIELQEVTRS